MKSKYFPLILSILIMLQLSDFLFQKFSLVQVNNGFIFGQINGNYLATVVAIVFISLVYFVVPRTKTSIIAFCFLSAGVASNIIDRFFYGGVVDYIKIWFIPIFNLADIVIVGSIIIIFWQIIKKSR